MSQSDHRGIAQQVAGSALNLFGRRVLVTLMTAAGTAVVARAIGTASFGQLSSAFAACWLAAAAGDFGISLVLGRDLAADPESRGRLLRAGFLVQSVWCLVPAGLMVGLGVASGLGSTHGLALVIFAPSVALGGLTGARQVFFALYRTRLLAAIDIATTALQVVAIIAVAEAGWGAVAVAAVMTATSMLNTLIVARGALSLVDRNRPTAADRRNLIRSAAPLGLISFVMTVYFSVDLVLLAWLVDAHSLGNYAAATKILSLLVTLPALIMSAALPGLATTARQPAALSALAGRIWHWLTVAGLPLCAAVAVFAGPVVEVAFGPGYAGAVPLVRILALAAAIALLTNVLGMVLVARRTVRPLLIGCTLAMVLNVGGNLLLVPGHGVAAAAWLTVATELFVAAVELWILRGSLATATAFSASWRPALAVGGFAATGLVLGAWPMVGIPIAIAVFVVLIVGLRAWPRELALARWQAAKP